MLRNLSLLAVVLLSLSSPAAAQQKPTVANSDNAAVTGAISGRVVNDSGQPLAGAVVRVYAANSVAQARVAAVDNEGNFYINGLDPAAYLVYATLPAYVTVPREVEPTSSYYRIGDSVRMELTKGGVVTGTVTTATGEPVVSVRVRALQIKNAKGEPPRGPMPLFSEQSTDDRGIYRIYGLTPGTYLVYAGGAAGQSFGMNAYDSDAPTYAPSSTRDTAAEIAVRAGEEANVDIRYRGEPGYVVSGSIKAPVSNGMSVSLMPAGPVLGQAGNTFIPPGTSAFSFNGIADGDYYLVAQASVPNPGRPADMLMSEPRRITVRGADVTGINLETKSLASISGHIALEPSKAPECQAKRQPLPAETLVTMERKPRVSDKDPFFLPFLSSSATADKDWNFIFRNLGPAQYSFNPRFFARYWFLQSITLPPPGGSKSNTRIDAARNWTNLKWGERLSGVTVTLAEGAASVRGKVAPADENTKIPGGLSSYLVPAERDKADDVLRFFVSEVAGDGSFALNNLPPGHYWMLVQSPENEASTMNKLRSPSATDARTKLRQKAEIAKKEIELKPCQNLTDYQFQYK
jgi:hypothetical protein